MVATQLDGAPLAAPHLLDFELANVCLIKARRHPEQKRALMAAFLLRSRLGVQNVAVRHDDVVTLAEVTGLTAYDASYLWLAQQLGAELVTLDRQLIRAEQALRG